MSQKFSTQYVLRAYQDETLEAWQVLCEYIDELARTGAPDFWPGKHIGWDHFRQIHKLPASIAKLKEAKRVILDGTQLRRIPTEVGEMESIEDFDIYTSYQINWLLFEISRCKKLKESTMSIRTLYGNYKTNLRFPSLENQQVYDEGKVTRRSICNEEITDAPLDQYWLTLRIGTDDAPLLVTVCSQSCYFELPSSSIGYYSGSHKGF